MNRPFQFGAAGRIFGTAKAKNTPGQEKNHDSLSHDRVRKEKRSFPWESDGKQQKQASLFSPSNNDHDGAGMPTIVDNRTDIVIDASNLGLTNENKNHVQAFTKATLERELRRRQGYLTSIVVGDGQLRINSRDFLFRLSNPILARQAVQMKNLLVQRADGNQITCKVSYQQQQGAAAYSPPPPPPRRFCFNSNRRRGGYHSNRPSAAAGPLPPPPPGFGSFNQHSFNQPPNDVPPASGAGWTNNVHANRAHGGNNFPNTPCQNYNNMGRFHFHQPTGSNHPPTPLPQNSRAEALRGPRPSKRRRYN